MNAVGQGLEDIPKRRLDDDGFLHVFLRFMRTGILEYGPDAFGGAPPKDAVGENGTVAVLVEPGALGDPESLASLAGKPALRLHDWATPEGEKDIVGSVAGAPVYSEENGVGYVECEAVVTDAETIRRLQSGELVEVSAAYHHDIVWEPGVFDGIPYAGRQTDIRYNHFVLLPEGGGRAGREVRAINSRETDAADGDRQLLERLRESDRARARLEAENAELRARIEELRKRLAESAASENIEDEADRIAAEREEATKVMAANGLDRARSLRTIRDGRLRGHELRLYALNAIRAGKGREAVPDHQAKNRDAVEGMWAVMREFSPGSGGVVGGFAPPRRAVNAAGGRDSEMRRALGFQIDG